MRVKAITNLTIPNTTLELKLGMVYEAQETGKDGLLIVNSMIVEYGKDVVGANEYDVAGVWKSNDGQWCYESGGYQYGPFETESEAQLFAGLNTMMTLHRSLSLNPSHQQFVALWRRYSGNPMRSPGHARSNDE